MSEYRIEAVSSETRTYDTKYGQMVSYKLKLEGVDAPVELGQKTTTPAPQAGATLSGHVEDGPYGKKFKKEQAQFGGGSGFTPQTSSSSTPTQAGTSGSTKSFDSFTMYLSYAKDLAVALVGTKEGFTADKYGELLEEVTAGGKTLYNDRPGAEPIPAASDDPTPAAEPDEDSDEAIKKKVDNFFADLED